MCLLGWAKTLGQAPICHCTCSNPLKALREKVRDPPERRNSAFKLLWTRDCNISPPWASSPLAFPLKLHLAGPHNSVSPFLKLNIYILYIHVCVCIYINVHVSAHISTRLYVHIHSPHILLFRTLGRALTNALSDPQVLPRNHSRTPVSRAEILPGGLQMMRACDHAKERRRNKGWEPLPQRSEQEPVPLPSSVSLHLSTAGCPTWGQHRRERPTLLKFLQLRVRLMLRWPWRERAPSPPAVAAESSGQSNPAVQELCQVFPSSVQ